MAAICQLCHDEIDKIAYVSHRCRAKSLDRQRLLIHGLVRSTGTSEIVLMEVI